MKLDMNLIQLWSILDFLKAFMNYSVHEFATHSPEKQNDKSNEDGKHKTKNFTTNEANREIKMYEVANGSSEVTEALWASLLSYEKTKAFKYYLNAKVTEITHTR